jgi:hypothetical protein
MKELQMLLKALDSLVERLMYFVAVGDAGDEERDLRETSDFYSSSFLE